MVALSYPVLLWGEAYTRWHFWKQQTRWAASINSHELSTNVRLKQHLPALV